MPLTSIRQWLLKDEQTAWSAHLRNVRSIRAWMHAIRQMGDPSQSGGDVTAIVLSYKRPQNIDAITRSLLHTPSVGKVILCNNNPRIDIRSFITVQSDRLHIEQRTEHGGTPERLRIARKETARFFLAADDDIFLRPDQYDILCRALKADPSRPHGMFGQLRQQDGSFRHAVTGEHDLDVLNRVYAFNDQHVRAFHEIAGRLGFDAEDWKRSDWDDLVLSFSGSGRPRSHDVGAFLDCPTQGRKGTAVWRRDHFFERRLPLLDRLQRTGSCTSSSSE